MREAIEEILNKAAEAIEDVKRARDAETFTDTRIELRHAVMELQAAIEMCEGLIEVCK